MPVTPKRARERALSLQNTSAGPHFDRIAFRTPRRTFATLALNGSDMNFMLDLAQQKAFCEGAPDALSPVPGGWGRMGWTHCDLKKVPVRTFDAVLEAAHALANAPKPKRARPPRSK